MGLPTQMSQRRSDPQMRQSIRTYRYYTITWMNEKKFETPKTKRYTQIRLNGFIIKIPKINIDGDLRCLFLLLFGRFYILNEYILLRSGGDERANASLCTIKSKSNLRRRTKLTTFYRWPRICEMCGIISMVIFICHWIFTRFDRG